MKVKEMLRSVASGLAATAVALSSAVCSFAADSESGPTALGVSSGIFSGAFESFQTALESKGDFGYKADLNITFGHGFKTVAEIDEDIKSIDISAVANSKDGKASADINVKYDSKSLVTLNGIYDSSNEKFYAKIPELNDAYLSGTKDEIEKLAASYMDLDDDDYDYIVGTEDYVSYDNIDYEKIEQALKDLDPEEFAKHLNEYADLIKEKLPEGKDTDAVTGEIDGHAYNYSAKSYTVTGNDAKSAVKAVADKAKSDDYFKKLAENCGLDEKAYNEMLYSLTSEFDDMTAEDLKEEAKFNVCYDGDSFRGIIVKNDDGDSGIVFVLNDDYVGLHMIDTYGLLVNNFYLSLSDFDFDNNNAKFKLKLILENNSENDDDIKAVIDIVSDSTEEKQNVTANLNVNEYDCITVKFTGEKIEPTDVTIPTENVYSIADSADLAKYLSNCDVEGFKNNLKNVLGESLYNTLINAFNGSNYEDYDEDSDPSDDSELAIAPSPTSEKKTNDSSSNGGSAKTGANNGNAKTSSNDRSVNTGVAAGAAVVAISLVGVAILMTKKNK